VSLALVLMDSFSKNDCLSVYGFSLLSNHSFPAYDTDICGVIACFNDGCLDESCDIDLACRESTISYGRALSICDIHHYKFVASETTCGSERVCEHHSLQESACEGESSSYGFSSVIMLTHAWKSRISPRMSVHRCQGFVFSKNRQELFWISRLRQLKSVKQKVDVQSSARAAEKKSALKPGNVQIR